VIAVAAVALVPFKLEFADADATARHAGAIHPPPVVALAPEEEPPAAAPAPPEPPAAATPPREPPKKKAAPPRTARKVAPPAPAAPPPEPVVQAALDPAPSAPRAPETGTLLLAVLPWGDIYIDGKRHGATPPLATIELPPGRHRVEIRNASHPSYFTLIQVQPGERRRLEHRFDD
jgi:hypothetical protein